MYNYKKILANILTKSTSTIVVSGTVRATSAACLHGSTVPSRYATKIPVEVNPFVRVVRIPRTNGSLELHEGFRINNSTSIFSCPAVDIEDIELSQTKVIRTLYSKLISFLLG